MSTEHTPKCKVDLGIAFHDMVGRTIARLERGTSEGPYGDEPTVTLHFTDGTRHTLVLTADFAPGYDETLDLPVKRIGSAHQEDVIGGRARCGVCGWIDEANPENPNVREWHGDSFGDGAEDLAERARLTNPPRAR
jgi:hypothetical protein